MDDSSSAPLASTSFDAYNAQIQTSALATTRKAAGLPVDLAFHRSMDRELSENLDAFSQKVLNITNRLLTLASTVDHVQGSRGKGKAKLENQDDVVDNFHALVVDSVDQMLERADTCLDEFWGKNKAPAIAINPPILSTKAGTKKPATKSATEQGRPEPVIQHSAHLKKPQLLFMKKVDNSDAPWYPTLSHKYNAKVPLGHIYTDPDAESSSGTVSNHPYRYEITHLTYPPRVLTPCTPVPPTSLEETEAIWVSTKDEFQEMLSKLKGATEIAVDLEHHSYRSYSGFLCLMQISDRENDWVIDLLAVRDEVEALNEVFTDPNIVKVFHGADSDVVWLQQDFNVYIVNLFDTFHASKLLDFPRHGLANLLEMYCDFVPDKRYQLADWRIRPLPADMLKYARSDTHFLLYIYDNLRNALLDRSGTQAQSRSPSSSPPPFASSSSSSPKHLLEEALARSAETSLKVYTKEPYDAAEGSGSGGWDTLAKRWNKIALTAGGPGVGIGAMQREVYKSVHWWRERAAREEDESTRYVLQNHVLFLIAEQPPADMAALLALFRSSVPPVVKRRAKELLSVIKDAVKRGMSISHIGGGQGTVEDANGAGSTTTTTTTVVETRKDVVMLDAEIKNLEKEEVGVNKVASTSIWGQGLTNAPVTSQSSLFGPSISTASQTVKTTASKTGPTGFATSVSTLFGSSTKSNIHTSSSSLKTAIAHVVHPRFEELVVKINRSFTLAPALPEIVPTSKPQAQVIIEETVKSEIDGGAPGMEVEVPYVAPSQRQTKQIKEEKDAIVVVGQARQKRKRKARSASVNEDDGGSAENINEKKVRAKAKSEVKGAEEPTEPFDFSAVPNILDDNPDAEARKAKRQKKQGNKGGNFYGDFPAPPRAYSELKSGNKSHTFK